jgi:hypothetical protein
MQHQAEDLVLDERKESKRAVAGPFHEELVALARNTGFDEAGTLANRTNRVACLLERGAIAIPRPGDCRLAVMKDVDIAREATRRQDDAEGDATGNVTLAAAPAIGR